MRKHRVHKGILLTSARYRDPAFKPCQPGSHSIPSQNLINLVNNVSRFDLLPQLRFIFGTFRH